MNDGNILTRIYTRRFK